MIHKIKERFWEWLKKLQVDSFCSGSDAPLAAQLIELLEECSQTVPQTLQMLADAASIIQ
jgi:hypothetical protein